MNTNNVAGWLESLPDTQRFLAATGLTFGTLAILGALGIMSPKQVRIVALMIFGMVAVARMPRIVAGVQPRSSMPAGYGPH
jgi:hypothetical protein